MRFTLVNDVGLKELAPLKNLQTLSLNHALVSDRTLQVLREIGLLHALSLATPEVGTGAKGPEEIVSLNLSGTLVTDTGLKELALFKNLHTLDLASTQVSSRGLKELAPFKKLHTLKLENTSAPFKELLMENAPVTDRTLQVLREIGLLHALSLATAEGNNRPKGPDEVIFLDLTATRVSNTGLKELVLLKNLRSLNLRYTKVSDVGLKELAPLINLQYLELQDTQVSDAGIKELQKGLPNCKISK